MPAWALRRDAAALLGYVCVAALFVWPLPLHMSSALLGSPSGDTGVYVWNLWVFRHELVEHGRLPFFTFEILALSSPVPLVLHNYTTFANLLALPLLAVFDIVTTYNLLTIGAGVLTSFAMYASARVRGIDRVPAWVGGLLFGFSPFMTARATGHFSLVLAAPIPVFAWVLHLIARQPSMKLACVAGAVVAWAFLCDPYYAVYCLMMAGFMAVHSVLVVERKPEIARRRWWALLFLDLPIVCLAGLVIGVVLRGGGQMELGGLRVSVTQLYNPVLALTVLVLVRIGITLRSRLAWDVPPLMRYAPLGIAGAFVCAVLLSPVLYAVGSPFGEAQWIAPPVPWRSSQPGVDLLAYFLPNPLQPWFGAGARAWLATLPNGFVENTASIPFAALAAIGIAVVLRFRPSVGWVTFTICFAVLSLGPFVRIAGQSTFVPTPWALLRYVPVIGAARVPTRMTVLMMFGVSMILAMALHHLLNGSKRRAGFVVAIVALLFVELLPAPRTLYSAEVPSVYQSIAEDPRPMRVLSLPFGLRDGLTSRGNFSPAYQFYQTVHEKPLVGGYLSRLPRRGIPTYRRNRVMRVLLRLSEGTRVEPPLMDAALAEGREALERLNIGWVVIDTRRAAPELRAFARQAFGLTLMTTDGPFELYRTELLD